MANENIKNHQLCFIITGGSIEEEQLLNFLKRYEQTTPYIIGVDNGCQILMDLQIPIHLAVGDFDTISPKSIEYLDDGEHEIIRLNPMKDLTDTHYALEKCHELGFSRVFIFGGTGTRLDHSLANILTAFQYEDMFVTYINKTNIVDICHGNQVYKSEFRNEYDPKMRDIFGFNYISLLPVIPTFIQETKGLKYGINNKTLQVFDSLAISNEIEKTSLEIIIGEGKLLIIYSRD